MKTKLCFLILGVILTGCVPLRTYVPSKIPYPKNTENQQVVQDQRLERPIRVAIAVRLISTRLKVPQSFLVSGLPVEGAPIIDMDHKLFYDLSVNIDRLSSDKAFIRPDGTGEVWVDGKKYMGVIEVIRDKKGTITIINELSLEDYVMGVLAGEVPRTWPVEALKAQAIAARTFAVYNQVESRKKGEAYDLESNSFSQVYQGSQLVNENIRQAVLATRGEILTYHDAPIMALFHSNCGGKTSGSVDVWNQGKPYLRSVSCSFGDKGDHFRWNAEIPVSDLVRKLRGEGIGLSDIIQMQVLDRDESDRARILSVMDADGQKKKIKGSTFRMAIGPDLIRSTRFDVEVRGNKVVFNGRGWGHGVGLCQEGVYGMAKMGYGAFDILRHYYHDVILDKMRN